MKRATPLIPASLIHDITLRAEEHFRLHLSVSLQGFLLPKKSLPNTYALVLKKRSSELSRWTLEKRSSMTSGWALTYGDCVIEAAGHFADLVAQAVLARRRRRRKGSLGEVIRLSIALADHLSSWPMADRTLARVLNVDSPREITERQRTEFLEELNSHIGYVGYETIERVRFQIAMVSPRRLPRKPTRRDELGIRLLNVEGANGSPSQKELCVAIDKFNIRGHRFPVLPSWEKKNGKRFWVDVFEDKSTHGAVKKHLTKLLGDTRKLFNLA